MAIKKLIGTQRNPARNAFEVTPSDSVSIQEGRAVYVGTGGGDLAVVMASDDAVVVLKNIASGTLLPISVSKVMATDTSVSDIVILY